MPDIDQKLGQWRREVEATLAFAPDEIAELEDHLQLVYDKKRSEGLESQSAWNHAILSLGSPNSLALEFTKNKLFPAFCRLLFAWSGALVLLGLFIGIDVLSFCYLVVAPSNWEPTLWAEAGFWAVALATGLFILTQLGAGQRRAVIAGLGNAVAVIPLLYGLAYNPLTESMIGHGWIRQGVSFEWWQICLALACLVASNLWWRARTISPESSGLMLSIVFLLTGVPFLDELLCNLSFRPFYDLPNRDPGAANLESFSSACSLYITTCSLIFVINITPLALSGIVSLGALWTQFMTRRTVPVMTPFPSREYLPWLFVMLASGIGWVVGRLIEPPFTRNLHNFTTGSGVNWHQILGHPLLITLEPIVLISAFVYLVSQYELTKRLRSAKSILPFYSWLLVIVEFGVAAGLACSLLMLQYSVEPLWLSFIFLDLLVFMMLWQMRIIRAKSDHGMSIWRFDNLAQNGLLAGIIVAIASLPIMMTAINCAISSNITYSVALVFAMEGTAHYTYPGMRTSPVYSPANHNPEMFTVYCHLPDLLLTSITYLSYCMTLAMAFIILISGLEFIRFNVWRLYKGRLIARLVELEKLPEESRPASVG